MGYPSANPTYKSNMKTTIQSQHTQNFLNNTPNTVVSHILGINLVNEHLSIVCKSNLSKAKVLAPLDSFAEDNSLKSQPQGGQPYSQKQPFGKDNRASFIL
ncbi:unnamed protein product [Linum trigynum]|uniref:Uncharacterized protein n=1 Tax=Linum trigynum TaxID=586398 RepID=A0AAV2EYD9_9ROSI